MALTLVGLLAAVVVSVTGGIISGSKAKQSSKAEGGSKKENRQAFWSAFGEFFKKIFTGGFLSSNRVGSADITTVNTDAISDWYNDPTGENSAAISQSVSDSGTANSGVVAQGQAEGNVSPSDVQTSVQQQTSTIEGSSAQALADTQQYQFTSGADLDNWYNNSFVPAMSFATGRYPYFDYSSNINDQRQFGIDMINDARQWEQKMADTRYQRAVEDIKKAGLNPWLALQGGSSISPATVGSVDTGSALGASNMSFSNGVSNSDSAVVSALIAAVMSMITKQMGISSAEFLAGL